MSTTAATPPNALHYLCMGINPVVETTRVGGKVLPAFALKPETFDPGLKLDETDDKGHTGTDTLLLGKERTNASAAPTFKDKLRFGEGIEDLIFLLMGSNDDPVAAVTNALTAKKWRFYRDVANPGDLPWCSLVQGYNWKTANAEYYTEAFLDSLEFTFNASEAPTYNATFLSNYPLYNQTEPTRVFAGTEYKLKAGQGAVYLGNVGDDLATLKADANKLDCYSDANLKCQNNMEPSTCKSPTFGEIKKDRNPFTANGEIKMDYNENNMQLEAESTTGSKTGTNVSPDSWFKQILIEYTGKAIETVSSTPVPMSMQVLIPKANCKISSTKSGEGKKELTLTFDVVSNTTSSPIEITMVSPLSALHMGTVPV